MAHAPLLVVVMGPSGCGKSTLAAEMAQNTNAAFVEGDDHHPPANKAKMNAGEPLSDTDRTVWLDDLTAAIRSAEARLVWLACSALTPYVQRRLREETERAVRFVLLEVPKEVLRERMIKRSDHYMPASLLDSQLSALDVPEDAIRLRADMPLSRLNQHLLEALTSDPLLHGLGE
ncbi:gluconokinase [Erythrobacter sp. W53]|uniref:gluconokinase n=1 Tax=Erythrobacter sp. W53 TaxID=3425947 RepID=UPI003D767108